MRTLSHNLQFGLKEKKVKLEKIGNKSIFYNISPIKLCLLLISSLFLFYSLGLAVLLIFQQSP